jgi:hypothetical protein
LGFRVKGLKSEVKKLGLELRGLGSRFWVPNLDIGRINLEKITSLLCREVEGSQLKIRIQSSQGAELNIYNSAFGVICTTFWI